MLTIKNLTKGYAGKNLFEEADIQVNYGEKIALVGPNGAGKSTIFSIVLKSQEPDAGTIDRDEWTTVGFLPQESEPIGEESVIEVATGRAGELAKLEKRLQELEADGAVDVPEYFETQTKFDTLNDPQLEAKAKKMLRGLGFDEQDFERQATEMSGGWVMRAHLARLLAMEPDLLMLDEPTNHLDLESLLWFQNYLKSFSNAVLMISHDREFMDQTIEKVYDIAFQKLVPYKGNYSKFEELREQNFQNQSAAYKNQQKQIKSLQDFANKFRSVSSKAKQVQSKLKEIERMDKVEKPQRAKKPFRFQIPEPPRGGQKSVALEGMCMAYGDRVIYENLDLTIDRGDRTVLVGPNGAGKSTLLKILAGVMDFDRGERTLGHNAKIGYFSQHRSANLSPEKNVIEEVMDSGDEDLREEQARGILGSFLFKKDDIYKKTEVLSGGEKSRLSLVKFLVDPPNLLLMDEPTTHLDLLSVESLILALEKYAGTLVFISHDVHFMRKLATKVLYVHDGQVDSYPGDYDYFLEKTGGIGNEKEALTAG
ncbi:MAG: ABC-F family ATP-binding cassette domain-containing protein [Verrucomicrobiota bacterium]